MNTIFASAPCMPKKSYHTGNAISQICTEILFRYNSIYKKECVENCLYLNESWNFHGRPYEKLFLKENKRVGSYQEVLSLAIETKELAQKQKSYFSSSSSSYNQINYEDTDRAVKEYSQDIISYLAENDFINSKGEELYLDLNKLNNKALSTQTTNDINIYPDYHKKTILNIGKTLNDLYPLTKNRGFASFVTVKNRKYTLNPIIQSLLMPSFLSKKHQGQLHTYVSGSGFGLLKWHYLTIALNSVLDSSPPYKNLYLHGTVLGTDKKKMSKHSNNTVPPEELYKLFGEKKEFVRYVLIRSICKEQKAIQIDKCKNELNKIGDKILSVNKTNFGIKNHKSVEQKSKEIVDLIKSYNFEDMIEKTYILFKNAEIYKTEEPYNNIENSHFMNLFKILLKP